MNKYILFFLLTAHGAVSAQNKTKQLDSLFTKLHTEKKFFGNVLIAEKGTVVYQKSFGKANLATNASLNSESIFELASVSKQFTAMGIMLLKKQGKLNYDDSLRKFFPELPYMNITVRHLLNHTSGLPDYMDLMIEKGDTGRVLTNENMIALLSKHQPATVFIPGEKWEYSNTGYALLGSIIEKASGMSFGDYLAKNIFKPLGMKNTFVYRRRFEKRTVQNYAYGFVMNDFTKTYVLPDDIPATAATVYRLDGVVGDGTVNSTTGDLLKWDRALYTEKIISKEMMSEAFTPAKLNNGKTYNYGFGWSTGNFQKGNIVSHSGGWPGYATFIERHVDTDKTIIVLSNHESRAPTQQVRNILYSIVPPVKKEIQLSAELLKKYEGEYELQPGFILTISTEGTKIFAQATGQQKLELFAEKEDEFFLKQVEAALRFIKDADKKITGVILYQNGSEIEAKKIK